MSGVRRTSPAGTTAANALLLGRSNTISFLKGSPMVGARATVASQEGLDK
jgi:hypothetical protein